MTSDYLSALALLKRSYDEHGTTYLDYVTPFVADTVRAVGDVEIETADLHIALQTRYGLDVPPGVINTLTKRLVKKGFGTRQNRCFVPDLRKLEEDYNFDARRSLANADIDKLSTTFVNYAQASLERSLTPAEATAALTAYANRNGLPILRQALDGSGLSTSLSLVETEYITSRFVVHAFENTLPECDTLVMLAKGSKLASVLYLPDPQQVDRNIGDLTAYFDTPTVLSALGYQGDQAELAARGILDLSYRSGLRLAVFDHTLEEVESVLHAVGSAVGSRRQGGRATWGVEAHFLSLGYNSSDIKLLIGRLRKDLASLRISVLDRPPIRQNLSIDESGLQEELEAQIGYARQEPMIHDLGALSAVFRVRRGNRPINFETSTAVFVTPNTSLTRAARSFFSREYGAHWPIALSEDDFSTLLWLKQPFAAPDLPQKQILADAYAALEPSAGNWSEFLKEVDRLKQDSQLTEDDYYYLRYSDDAKSALVDETARGEAEVTAETVKRVRSRTREAIASPIREKADADLREAIDERDKAMAASQAATQEVAQIAERQRNRARRKGQRRAQRVVRVLLLTLVTLFVVGLWLSVPSSADLPPANPPAWMTWVSRVTVAVLLVATLASLVDGWHLRKWSRRLELWLSGRFEAAYLADAGFEPEY